ncbi:MAG: membrane protein insertion efficiency factor YidD [Thermoactinomyces sp.]
MKWIALSLIHFYRRFISPLKPPTCRFVPTCSEYALTAFQRYGFVYGGWLTLRRLLKCHPFHPGGFDYVPEKQNRRPNRSHSDRSSR